MLSACVGAAASFPPHITAGAPAATPARFEPVDPALRTVADTLAGPGCINPLADPRDGRTIQLRRSQSGVGDYETASGYGLGPGQLLRVECNSGKVLGVVGW
jgi:hypothetical protein